MVIGRFIAISIALGGCIDLGIEKDDFACQNGGPCIEPVGGEEEDPPPDAGAIASEDAEAEAIADAEPNAPVDAGANADAGAIADAQPIDTGAICAAGPHGTWQQLSPVGALPRAGHSAVVDTQRNRAVIYGGAGTEGRLFALDVSGSPTFEPIPTDVIPPPRSEHATVYVEAADGIVVFGGSGTDGLPRDDTWTVLFGLTDWIEQEPLSTPRFSAAGAMLDSVVDYPVLLNGCDDQGVYGDDHQFDVVLALVAGLTTPFPKPQARCDQTATTVPGWGTAVFGGRHNTDALGDLWLLVENYPSRWWSQVPADGPPRYGHSTVFDLDRRRLLVFGGIDATGARSDELWAFSIDAECWGLLEPIGPGPSARAQHAAFMLGGKMYLVAGDDGSIRDDLWSLSF